MIFYSLFQWIYATPIAAVMRTNDLLFPWVESIHVLAITIVFGSIAIVDLRLLGVASLDRAVTRLSSDVLPTIWTAKLAGALSLTFWISVIWFGRQIGFST